MPDVKDVINGLECCSSTEECGKQCPYWYDEGACRTHLEADALALLKSQEPVEPVRSKGGLYHCGGCGEICVGYEVDFTHSIIKVANYCHKCGRKVKW